MKLRLHSPLSRLRGCGLVFLLAIPSASAQTLVTKFRGASSDDRAGAAVAISGSSAAIGSPRAHGTPFTGDGAVHVLRLAAGGWPETATSTGVLELLSPPSPYAETFGTSVALRGPMLVVGEPERDDSSLAGDCGAAHVYRDDGTSVTYEATLVPTLVPNARSGDAVAASGELVAIGAPGSFSAPPDAGRVFLYRRAAVAPHWSTPEAELTGPGGVLGDRFGYSVALSGDLCVVGAPDRDAAAGDAGAAYVFLRTSAGWVFDGELGPIVPVADAAFGVSVAIDGPVALVGAPGEDAAYLFRRVAPGNWQQLARWEGVDPAHDESFGAAVSIEGDRAVVGATLSDAVHVFRRVAPATWRRSQRLHELYTGGLGAAVAQSGEFVLGGAQFDDDAGTSAGAAFFFRVSPNVDAFGFGEVGACPCGNDEPLAGCANSTGEGAILRAGGSASLALGDLSLAAARLPVGKPCLLIAGDGAGITPLGAGLRAVRPGVEGFARLHPFGISGAEGTYTLGPGSLALFPHLSALVSAGETWNFQCWYRDDPHGACSAATNFSNALAITFLP